MGENRFYPYTVHPFADRFPLMETAEFERLVEDIAKYGLVEPIVLDCTGKVIIDGRNRYLACDRTGVTLRTVRLNKVEESIILHRIVAANVHRRHLTTAQAAMLALEYERRLMAVQPGPKNRPTAMESSVPVRTTPSQYVHTKAGEAFGVSESTLERTRRLERDHPELYEKVKAGNMTVGTAYKKVREPKPKPGQSEPEESEGCKPPQNTLARLQELAPTGLTSRQIADRLNASLKYIRKLASEHKIRIHGDSAVGHRRRIDYPEATRRMADSFLADAMMLRTLAGAVPESIDDELMATLEKAFADLGKAVNELRRKRYEQGN